MNTATNNRERVCRFCGVEAPRGHWRPFTWVERHEEICRENPNDIADYHVICDESNNSPEDIINGRVNADIYLR